MQKTCHTAHSTTHTKCNNSTCKTHVNKRMTLDAPTVTTNWRRTKECPAHRHARGCDTFPSPTCEAIPFPNKFVCHPSLTTCLYVNLWPDGLHLCTLLLNLIYKLVELQQHFYVCRPMYIRIKQIFFALPEKVLVWRIGAYRQKKSTALWRSLPNRLLQW
jgi:hypothetical protein